jgi:hypothetical protein
MAAAPAAIRPDLRADRRDTAPGASGGPTALGTLVCTVGLSGKALEEFILLSSPEAGRLSTWKRNPALNRSATRSHTTGRGRRVP